MTKKERNAIANAITHLGRVERFLKDDSIMIGQRKDAKYANASNFVRGDVPALGQKAEALAVFDKEYGSELAILFSIRRELALLLEPKVPMPYLPRD